MIDITAINRYGLLTSTLANFIEPPLLLFSIPLSQTTSYIAI